MSEWQQEGTESEAPGGSGLEEGGGTGGTTDDANPPAEQDWEENEPSPHQGEEGQQESEA